MAERKELPQLKLATNIAVRVRPWSARVIPTKYGERMVLTVKREGAEEEFWADPGFATDLQTLGVLEIGEWEDTKKVKLFVKKGAPDILLLKKQDAGAEHPTITAALANGEQPKSAAKSTGAPAPKPSEPPTMDHVDDEEILDLYDSSLRHAWNLAKATNEKTDPSFVFTGSDVKEMAASIFIARCRKRGW